MEERGVSYITIAGPGKVLGLADGNVFEAIDGECDGLDIDR